jgi:hypothetical protein
MIVEWGALALWDCGGELLEFNKACLFDVQYRRGVQGLPK